MGGGRSASDPRRTTSSTSGQGGRQYRRRKATLIMAVVPEHIKEPLIFGTASNAQTSRSQPSICTFAPRTSITIPTPLCRGVASIATAHGARGSTPCTGPLTVVGAVPLPVEIAHPAPVLRIGKMVEGVVVHLLEGDPVLLPARERVVEQVPVERLGNGFLCRIFLISERPISQTD